VEACLAVSHLLLGVSSGSEVACPVVLIHVCIGEHVIIASGPSDVFLFQGINILHWGRVKQSDIVVFLVEVLDQVIERVELHMGIGIGEVCPEHDHQVVALVMVRHVLDVLIKLFTLFISIELGVGLVTDHGIIITELFIEPEA
jgi:hypothetical protein